MVFYFTLLSAGEARVVEDGKTGEVGRGVRFAVVGVLLTMLRKFSTLMVPVVEG